MKKKDKIRKIIVYSLAVIFLMGTCQMLVESRQLLPIPSEKEQTVLTSFSTHMKLIDCKKEESENGPFSEGKEENGKSENGEQFLYYLALGEFLMLLGFFLFRNQRIERFGREYLRRTIYIIRYMQDMDGRKKYLFCLV